MSISNRYHPLGWKTFLWKVMSGFTDDSLALLAGVNAGGRGTLVASMVNLISYKLYTRSGGSKLRSILVFTAISGLFLIWLCLAWRLRA